ncbi:MAG: radical SAM protein, partial [Clostridiales bacterium]
MATMLFARPNGQWLDFPPLEMAAKSGNYLLLPKKNDLIPLPEGATLTMMPGAAPYGFDKENGEFILLEENPYQEKHEEICAIAALLPQGFSRSLLPAADDAKNPLPILGYTAVGISKGKLVIAAQQTDEYQLWHPRHYNTKELPALVEKRKKEFPGNSIIEQLAKCSLEYGCFTAQNIFYRRWEGGIPVSPQCNAHCLACISLQESQCCPSPQSRIKAAPQVREVVEIAAVHLAEAPKAIISFGQGCEGEPSLQFELIKKAIGEIRALTKKGIININTNAGNTQAIKEICHGGIDSMRVSLFSPIEEDYAAYHRP